MVVDSHSLIYQVFHAMPPMTSPKGVPVGAIHGFLRDLAELQDRWKPTHILCAFDASGETFRNEIYPAYKEHRDPMPENLRAQIPLIHEAVRLLGFPILSIVGFEADDILATITAKTEEAGCRCILVTADKDCRQLLSDRVQLYNIRKKELFGPPQLLEVWGIQPNQVVDFQSMVGDSADNVPGVPLIGPKFATELLQKFGTLEEILQHIDQVPGAKRQENFRTYRDQALLSQQLVELRRDVPIDWQWGNWRTLHCDHQTASQFFSDLGLKKVAERFLIADEPIPSAPTSSRCRYQTIQSLDALQSFVDLAMNAKWVAFDSETTSTSARGAEPVGFSLATYEQGAIYVPLLAPEGTKVLPLTDVTECLRPLLESKDVLKIGQNLKFDAIVLRALGISLRPIAFDTMVADYLIDAGQRNHGLEDIAKRWLHVDSISIDALIGTGKSQIRMDQVPLEKIAEYACEDVDLPLRLKEVLLPRLESEGLVSLFHTLELPLIDVLAEMEFNGICVDTERLKELSDQFSKRIDELFSEIMQLAGREFNPDSPKQLATILFEELHLPVIKKTKTGPSTDVEVLQELAEKHLLPAKIIEYRQLTKLKGTYVDALPDLLCAKTGRVHTSFRQDVAATGRLSSTDPNLQNIPVRTDEGRKIRSAFRPGPSEWVLLTADYSQIELRVLAHFSGDDSLRRAFEEKQDIHAMVASQVYEVPLDEVTTNMRRSAKAINFGIIYGQSPFGLAKALSISQEEASHFIDAYFAKYPGVPEFMLQTLTSCRRDGYVSTIAGRKRWIRGVRDFAALDAKRRKVLIEPERMAVNTVIQGSAADMIKLAMIAIHRELNQGDWKAKMLLQIHDELIFEVHPDELDRLRELVIDKMTSVVPLNVPLVVDSKTGPNWEACVAIS
ncbi:MAG: DNA polymerase I [Pirellulales bacterium]